MKYCLYLGLLFCSPILGLPSEESSSEGPEESDFSARASIFCILTALILLSILFDVLRDVVEEHTTEAMKPIIESLWKELTVLGFLSLLSFLAVKSGILSSWSEKIFGEGEEEELPEMVETVHMLLFLVMVIFLIEVLLLVRLAVSVERNWRSASKDIKNPAKVLSHYYSFKRNPPSMFHVLAYRKAQRWIHRCEYLMMRTEFVSPRDASKPKLAKNFDFGEYLSINMGNTLGDVVEIHPIIWTAWEVLFVGLFFAMTGDPLVQIIIYILFGYSMVFGVVLCKEKMDSIRNDLLPEIPEEEDISDKTSLLVNAEAGAGSKSAAEDGDSAKALPFELKEAPFLKKPVPGISLTSLVKKRPSNRHEALFWFGAYGPGFFLNVLRFVMLCNALYLAMGGFYFVAMVFEDYGWIWLCLFIAITLFPSALLSEKAPQIINRHVVISNVEMMKKKDIINKVLRSMKTKQAVRCLKVLNSMKSYSRKVEKGAGKAKIEKRKDLDPASKQHISEVFALFDKDGDGTIKTAEFSAFMSSLGTTLSDVEAAQMVTELDLDGDGDLSEAEFFDFMSDQAQSHDESPEETIQAMFDIFDKDKSGSISTEEFRATMRSLGSTLSADELEELIKDIDEDGDGDIDLEEFTAMIKKHT